VSCLEAADGFLQILQLPHDVICALSAHFSALRGQQLQVNDEVEEIPHLDRQP
jgi:hypothetical protein